MDAPRIALVGLAGAVVALILYFPERAIWIVLACALVIGVGGRLASRRCDEPYRRLILRLGHIQRLSPAGVFMVLPLIDQIAGEPIDMRPLSQEFTVTQIASGDDSPVLLNLEVTWRLRPDLDRVDAILKQTLLKSEEQRRKMIEQAVSVVARQLLLNYTARHLSRADNREQITEILRTAVNELLHPSGLTIDTIFWRGAPPPAELHQAKLAIKISRERLEAMISNVELVHTRLPQMPAEEFLAYQAWIELLHKGMSPPQMPNLPYPATKS